MGAAELVTLDTEAVYRLAILEAVMRDLAEARQLLEDLDEDAHLGPAHTNAIACITIAGNNVDTMRDFVRGAM